MQFLWEKTNTLQWNRLRKNAGLHGRPATGENPKLFPALRLFRRWSYLTGPPAAGGQGVLALASLFPVVGDEPGLPVAGSVEP